MARRIEISGADSVPLSAWEYAAHPVPAPSPPEGTAGLPAAPGSTPLPDPAAAPVADLPSGIRGRPGVLLLHGLMGRASHWSGTARRLTPRYRAVALDQRGHGSSGKPEGPYSREAYVSDAEAAIEQLGLGPAVLIGHSMGALTAWQLAARRPDLVSAVIICDMRASALGEESQHAWEEWFESWPLPFVSLDAARRWFAEDDPWVEAPRPTRGEFFAELMEQRADGWWPVFARRHMLSSREPWVSDSHWEELSQVRCPALVVRGWDGELGRAEAQEMVRVLPRGSYAEIPDAGYLLPWDQPGPWYEAVESFLAEVAGAAGSAGTARV